MTPSRSVDSRSPHQPVGRVGRLGPYPWLALLGAVPLLLLAVFAYLVSAGAMERLVHRSNDATATITAALVEREFEHWTATLEGIAEFPALQAAVASGNVLRLGGLPAQRRAPAPGGGGRPARPLP